MLNHQKYWYCDMNNFLTESWILNDYSKIINTICRDNTFKTQIMTKTRALIEPHNYVAERIKQKASDMLICSPIGKNVWIP